MRFHSLKFHQMILVEEIQDKVLLKLALRTLKNLATLTVVKTRPNSLEMMKRLLHPLHLNRPASHMTSRFLPLLH
ncbi:unnamed protein product [Hymenolepis diminuta]|uniref:Uncharacterized protein n=1 Tax=Hymenolepis diminuta TaxID=6216 RepID=A0A564Y4M2_HYMDI|nr:unnamed protein product [Hymenolepis diminuta]